VKVISLYSLIRENSKSVATTVPQVPDDRFADEPTIGRNRVILWLEGI